MESQVIFDKNSIEFVDVAIIILLFFYLKALLIPKCEPIGEYDPDTFVTEDDYEFVRTKINGILAHKDDYLEVFMEDMKYSDTPIKRTISEDLADIYQDLKDFISVFQIGFNITMNDSLFLCKEHFADFWGQRLVNALKALHDIKYGRIDDDDEYLCEDEENDIL